MLPRDWRLVVGLVLQPFLDLDSALGSVNLGREREGELERELELSRSCLILNRTVNLDQGLMVKLVDRNDRGRGDELPDDADVSVYYWNYDLSGSPVRLRILLR